MPTSDNVRATAERISGNPTSGAIRLFIDDLITALDDKPTDSDSILVTERREQPRLQ